MHCDCCPLAIILTCFLFLRITLCLSGGYDWKHFFSFSFFCSRERWGSLCSEDHHLLLTKGATIKNIHLEQPCALLFHTTRSNQGCTDKRWLRGCQSVSGLAHRDRHSTLSVNVRRITSELYLGGGRKLEYSERKCTQNASSCPVVSNPGPHCCKASARHS